MGNNSSQRYRLIKVSSKSPKNMIKTDNTIDVIEECKECKNYTELSCKICFKNKINMLLRPCMHCCLCHSCAKNLEERNDIVLCPICKTEIDKIELIYI